MSYQVANKGYEGISRRSLLSILAAAPIAAASGLAGCTTTHKSPWELSDQEVMDAYMNFARIVSPRVHEALTKLAINGRYANVLRDTYFSIVQNETLKLATDPDVQKMLSLQREFVSRHLARRGGSEQDPPNMDVSLLRKSPDTLYPVVENLPAFYDPELLFPALHVNLVPDRVSNPFVYKTHGGIESILVPPILPNGANSTRSDRIGDASNKRGDFDTDWHSWADLWTNADLLSKIQTIR